MAGMARYAFFDAYTREELKRKYQNANSKGRIELLKEFSEADRPQEIELMAVEDPDPQVRQWIARCGTHLKYTSVLRQADDGWVHDKLDPDLYEKLKKDHDPFVRACLLENPNVSLWHPADKFSEATHLERLALMRNPEMWLAEELLKKIFDYEEAELGISNNERAELILAFLTNKAALDKLQEQAGLSGRSDRVSDYGYNKHSAESFLSSLWELAAKWPTAKLPAPVPELTYSYVPVSDKTKSGIYQKCDKSILRGVILRSCSKQDIETIRLGVKDEDSDCRSDANHMAARYGLENLVDDVKESDSDFRKRIANRFTNWRNKNEPLWVAGNFVFWVGLAAYLLLFTEEGNRVFDRLFNFYSTPVGTFLFWVFVIVLGLIALSIFQALYEWYRWFYHLFWLGMIVGFYINGVELVAAVSSIFYGGSIVVPKIWKALSDEIADKVVKKLELSKKPGG
jgi:hypothetical protein